MSVLTSVLALIVTLGILVTVHEFGHFWVARRCGVKVLRFSVGFGKPLWKTVDRHGTEFAIAGIPLGGYVKMLDEREGPVDESELHLAFNRKTVWQRMAVVLAGPLANILFAIAAYWLMFVVGVTQVKPILGDIESTTPAGEAGLISGMELHSIDGVDVSGWQDVRYQLLKRIGDTGVVQVTTKQGTHHELTIDRWLSEAEEPSPLGSLGLSVYVPEMPAVIEAVLPGEAAETAGLRPLDKITKVNGLEVKDWQGFVAQVKASPNQRLALTVESANGLREVDLYPKVKVLDDGTQAGFIGAMAQRPDLPENFIQVISFGPIESLGKGIAKTWDMSVVTLESIVKMLKGLLSVKNLSGPITIAKVANDSAKAGFEAFIGFLAYISIMLAVVNLLPIPVLDGGHFLFYVIEAVKGSPLSERVQLMGVKLGMSLLLVVMFIAIFNDINRI